MRIAIDGRELGGQPTGAGRYLSELLIAWAERPLAARHEFILCTPEPVSLAPYGQLPLSNAVAPGAGTLWEQFTLPRIVSARQADVLFCPAYTCPLWCPVPIVLMIHDVSYAAHPEWFGWREGLRRRTLTRLGARRAARVLTLSNFSKREITRLLGIAPARVEVTYLGASALHQARGREPLVLYVGSIFNRRHIPELIEGFSQVAVRLPDTRLEIVGDNRTNPHIAIDGLIEDSGLSNRIHARSFVSDAELASLYGSASAFAFLSEYEGFGLTPLEAMSAGVPVVVLDTEVAREIYGDAALYIEKPDPHLIALALERLLMDESERTKLVAAGTRRAERYSWRACAEQTLEALVTTR